MSGRPENLPTLEATRLDEIRSLLRYESSISFQSARAHESMWMLLEFAEHTLVTVPAEAREVSARATTALSARDALTTASLRRIFADETDAFDEFVANHKRLDLDYLNDCADGTCRAARRQADDVLAVLADANYEATVKAEAIRELAQKQRQLATNARTSNGHAEHTDRADWLDDQANAIDPARLEGAHP